MNEVPELSPNQKYFPLQEYFRSCSTEVDKTVALTVDQIEKIIGNVLPRWAFDYSAGFWSNGNYNDHVQKRAWLSQDYIVIDYNVNSSQHSGRIVFEKSRR